MLKNNSFHYGKLTLALHWITALIMIGAIVAGILLSYVLLDGEFKWSLYPIHKTLGVCIFILVVIRIIWHKLSPVPAIDNPHRWQKNAQSQNLNSLF